MFETASCHTCYVTCCHWKLCKFLSYAFTLYKTHHGLVIACFSVSSAVSFSYAGCILLTFNLFFGIWWLSGNYNAQGAFVIIFFICRDLLNYLKHLQSLYYHYVTYITANYSYKCMKIIIIKEISICVCHFEES